MSILDFLKRSPEGPAGDTETVRRIVAALDGLDPSRARFVAAFAYVLGRVAHVDSGVSADETRAMERVVAQHGGLSEAEAVVAVQVAKTQARLFGGTENFVVTRELKEISTREQLLALLHCLFELSACDEHVSGVEDAEIRKIARELGLSHDEFIAARLSQREHLGWLKPASREET